ncbi:Atr2p KNAG_0J00260 [Huiozyma naganishii CBS 8797]|uniref:Major facilitator superfamily (MFS) profile domain-containing protein n=1 Tax=Huiozyma naganishii (strain ATCC MYA-139 / BCRC 22969 / CBS 8797 / KCTC 17520 / NBRC 10181 / NCYC 3082 / Yp74L-3) TaxID=1071383 RepID=J7S9H2_HUIN7|nr:hypothetical protein KNAG_0J00260 [Kazachstania naganishii CBS 8797]CCK72109.1 hypothetical protein KNAG_0J00260 [Kazachstania naganishii CBS 8797]
MELSDSESECTKTITRDHITINQEAEYTKNDQTNVEEKKNCSTESEAEWCSESEFTDNDTPWQNPTYFANRWQEYAFISTCMLAQLLNQAGQAQATAPMNILADAFNSSAKKQTWLMASFPLVSGSFILVSGRIGDIYGLKKTLIGGYLVVLIWSLICGFANYTHNDAFFILCRAFQGLGIAFILPNVMGLIGNIYKANTLRKNFVISFVGMCAPIGAALGGVWSGLIAHENPKQWPWIFYAYAIVVAINMVMAIYSIPSTVPTNIHGFGMDWTGSAIGVVGMILFNFVWNQGPIDGWNKGYIIALLIVSVFLLIAFFIYEIKFAKSPLLPPEVIKNRHIGMILLAVFMGWGSFGIWTFYYYAFQLNLRHYSAVWAGGTFFMFVIWGTIAAFLVALTIKRVGPSVLLCFSMTGFTVGCIMLSVTPVHQSYWKMNLGMQIILSFGMDLSFPASSIILSDFLPSQYQGMAGSLVNTMVNYSTSLCLGVGSTAEAQVNKNGTDKLKGYRAALYVGIGLGACGMLVAFCYLFEVLWIGRKKRLEKRKEKTTATC